MPPAFVLSQDQTLRLTAPIRKPGQSTEARSLTHYPHPRPRPKPKPRTGSFPSRKPKPPGQINASSFQRHAKARQRLRDAAARASLPLNINLSKNKPRVLAHRLVARGRTYTSGPSPCQTLSARFPQLRQSRVKPAFPGGISGARPSLSAAPRAAEKRYRGRDRGFQPCVEFLAMRPLFLRDAAAKSPAGPERRPMLLQKHPDQLNQASP
jgi:hypothetical protein